MTPVASPEATVRAAADHLAESRPTSQRLATTIGTATQATKTDSRATPRWKTRTRYIGIDAEEAEDGEVEEEVDDVERSSSPVGDDGGQVGEALQVAPGDARPRAVRLGQTDDDGDERQAEQDVDHEERRRVAEPRGEVAVGQLPAGQWTDDVRQARAEVDVAEEPVAVGRRGGVGDGALGDRDVRLAEAAEERRHHQQREALHDERGTDDAVPDGGRAEGARRGPVAGRAGPTGRRGPARRRTGRAGRGRGAGRARCSASPRSTSPGASRCRCPGSSA